MENIRKASDLLRQKGFGGHFGSKSGYRDENPSSDPIFNSYLLTADQKGLLQVVYGSGDIELTSEKQMTALKEICQELRQDLYIYHESTVHNQTFNGRVFPYERYRVKVSFRGSEEPTVEIKER